MPWRGPKVCSVGGCGRTAAPGASRCAEHLARPPGGPRESPSARGYDRAWERLRIWFLNRNPFCAVCGAPAEEVDHMMPLAQGGARLDQRNLQAMCKPCHSRKTATERMKAEG